MNTFAMIIGGVLVGSLATTVIHAQATKTPPAYIMVEFTIKDQEGWKEYGQKAPETITKHGGRFVVRGGKVEKLAGQEPSGPVVVLAFDSAEQAKKWLSSPEYTAIGPVRDRAADVRAFLVEGVAQ